MKVRQIGKPSEHQVQASIVSALQLCGFTVQETTAYRQKGSSGVDKGIPDLLVWCPGLTLAIGIEVKADSKSWVSPEQKQMVAFGYYTLAWTPEMALKAVWKALDGLSAGFTGAWVDAANINMDRIERVLRSLEGK